MSDEPSPAFYAPFIALAVVIVLFVLALVGVVVAVLIAFVLAQAGPPAVSINNAAPLNRLAVIAGERLYTIDPDGSDRIDLAHNGRVPTAAVIWSHDGQHLIFAESERAQSRLSSASPDGQETRVLYEAELIREPFYLYGSPDDRHVAFLASDPLESMQLHIAETDRPDSARAAVTGQPNYASWSPDSQALLVHIGGVRADAFVGTYNLSNATTQKIETRPSVFQAPFWSPAGQLPWLYARRSGSRGELVIGDAQDSRALAEFDDGIAFGRSPDGQRVAYALNTPDSFLYENITVVDLADSSSKVVFKGNNVLAFFWSPDGTQLAYLTGALVEPSPVGRTGGLAALNSAGRVSAPQHDTPGAIFATTRQAAGSDQRALTQQRTLQVTWHVIDLASGRTNDLNSFEPTDSFIYLIQYFDQFEGKIGRAHV